MSGTSSNTLMPVPLQFHLFKAGKRVRSFANEVQVFVLEGFFSLLSVDALIFSVFAFEGF